MYVIMHVTFSVVRVSPGSSRSVTEPHTASEPSGQELVTVGMAGRRNGPPLSMRYDDDDFHSMYMRCMYMQRILCSVVAVWFGQ